MPTGTRGTTTPIVGQFLPNHLNMLTAMLWGALLVAMSEILYAHIWAYAPNTIDFGP